MKSFGKVLVSLDLTLPYRQHVPASFEQFLFVLPIPLDVSGEFRTPVACIGSRRTPLSTLPMLVPEAAVHEDGFPPSYERQIRLARKIASMKAEAITHRINKAAYSHFGLHALASNSAHVCAASLGRKFVHWTIDPSRCVPLRAANEPHLGSAVCKTKTRERRTTDPSDASTRGRILSTGSQFPWEQGYLARPRYAAPAS
jgi:hypothetical protein